MKPEPRIIAVSQRVVEVSTRGEVRDCLDQAWSTWLATLGCVAVPVPNHPPSVPDFLRAIQPAGIVLSGGNNLTGPVYEGLEAGAIVADAYESRDRTEKILVDHAVGNSVPLLGCCRGMQFLQTYFGGRLCSLKDSPVVHVAKDHEVSLVLERFRDLAGKAALTVNSFHNYGIRRDAVAAPLLPFALSSADSSVEGFLHPTSPILGITWHPERRDPAAAFDRDLATRLFTSDYFRLHEA
jgi:gamma-glutamyl-gamma-aminobutyrate hydrolase PuuD